MEKIQTRIKALEIYGHDDAAEDIIVEVERDGISTWVQVYNARMFTLSKDQFVIYNYLYGGLGKSTTDISLKSLPHVIKALERIEIELKEDLPEGDQDGE